MTTGSIDYSPDYKLEPSEVSSNYLRVGPGGLCFAHGPFTKDLCPQWPNCVTDPQKAMFIAMGRRQPQAPDECARLERKVIDAAKAERDAYAAPLSASWLGEVWAAQNRLHGAVNSLLQFESLQEKKG